MEFSPTAIPPILTSTTEFYWSGSESIPNRGLIGPLGTLGDQPTEKLATLELRELPGEENVDGIRTQLMELDAMEDLTRYMSAECAGFSTITPSQMFK